MTTLATVATATDVFDRTHDALLGSDVHAAITRLRTELRSLRSYLPADEWRALGEHVRRHPIHDLLLESPFTRRAFTKPRGYAGDAVLMDLIYGLPPDAVDLSPLGGMLYAYEFDSPCFQSVRTRRAVLAREIDDVAGVHGRAQVLAVASGHLREVEWSRAVWEQRAAITAIDQDRDSLDFVERHYRRYDVAAAAATVGDVLRRTFAYADADLVYAAGLYDYLNDGLARTLSAALFRMLRSGGRLLIANFTPATHDAAFMEAIMDWHLIYRTPAEVRALAASIPQHQIAVIEQFCDENGHVAYMRLVKR